MKTTKHTPGPWRVGEEPHEVWGHNPLNLTPANTYPDPAICRTAHLGWDRVEERHANARLIAKAPELLAALVDTLDALHNETHGQDDTPWIQSVKDRARALIAQATGQE